VFTLGNDLCNNNQTDYKVFDTKDWDTLGSDKPFCTVGFNHLTI
jgi:hypothetical protein